MNIPDLIEEQRVADLVNRAPVILASAEGDPIAECHVIGERMARAVFDYFEAVVADMEGFEREEKAIQRMRNLRDHAQQLRTHHLDLLDRLTEA